MDIAASILNGDWARLGATVEALEAAGCDSLHLDVMDGRFVPEISFGAAMVGALRPHFDKDIEAHLMVVDAGSLVASFARAGADTIIVHPEADSHIDRTLTAIRRLGKRAGVALNPATPVHVLEYLLERLDMIVIMGVNPGYGGQEFISSQLGKVRRVREMVAGHSIRLVVDGGVDPTTIGDIAAAGADQVVVGSWLFRGESRRAPDDFATPLASLRAPLRTLGR